MQFVKAIRAKLIMLSGIVPDWLVCRINLASRGSRSRSMAREREIGVGKDNGDSPSVWEKAGLM